jgi:type I restriction enzyme S subunit
LISEIAKGTNINNLKREHILDFEFPLPPLSEQQTIVAKLEEFLSELEKGKEQLHTALDQLKVYRQAVLRYAFEGKLTNKNVKEGELPEGWKWVKVLDISNVVRGGSPRPAGDLKYYGGKIPFLKVADLTRDGSIFLHSFEYTIKEAGLRKTRQIKPETLLLTNSGATLGVPKICMIDATMNDGIAAFLDLDKRSNLYMYYYWTGKTQQLRNVNQGAAQPNLNTDIIKNCEVPYCSFEEQERVVQEIESHLSVADKLEETITASLQQSETLRQSILKKAFEGKLV